MKDAADYLVHLKALIIINPRVAHWSIIREEADEDAGLFRYQLVLHDGSRLEMFERFYVKEAKVRVTKYSFHWQDANGRLRKRWDNAPHYLDISTYPHHIHDGSETNVLPYHPVTAEEILETIARETPHQESKP